MNKQAMVLPRKAPGNDRSNRGSRNGRCSAQPRLSHHRCLSIGCSLLVFYAIFVLFSGAIHGKQIAGWIEQAALMPSGIVLKAKLDTGAKNSSLDAKDMQFFTKDEQQHVHFKVKNKAGESVEIIEPVLRHIDIKRHFGRSQERPVIMLSICIGKVLKEVAVNLVDRSGFNYPLLIGRSYLSKDFLIDASLKYQLEPACAVTERP
jgi:hypothetical protein